MHDHQTKITKHITEMIRAARSIVVLTGAGVSAESGLSTFRDPQQGLWSKYDPMELATIDAFNRDPELVTRWYHWRFTKARDVSPNPAHTALADLEKWQNARGRSFTLLTQNIDGLHQRGGSKTVVELHGSILRWRCTETGKEKSLDEICFDEFPVPSEDGGLMRPCVVWFGESLPKRALRESFESVEACDLFLSIGTSAVVYPAAGFIQMAAGTGARTIEVNAEQTPISESVDLTVRGKAGAVLPKVVEALEQVA